LGSGEFDIGWRGGAGNPCGAEMVCALAVTGINAVTAASKAARQ
jgi:hypothetical protein